ncbi:MAG: hypothetical protein JJ975_00460 [Bacteroidia bacterium]|nr:hypothetical protein [Bacteroidia bacterium]
MSNYIPPLARKEFCYTDYERPSIVEDLDKEDRKTSHLAIYKDTKNLHVLSEFDPEYLWLINLNEPVFHSIIEKVNPRFLHVYGCKVTDYSPLEHFNLLEICIVIWNTKARQLWQVEANTALRELHIENLAKLHDFTQLRDAHSLRYLGIEGGMWEKQTVTSLDMLNGLSNLERLRLVHLKIVNGGLQPLADLTQLQSLGLSNAHKTEDVAWLSTRLSNTICNLFAPYVEVEFIADGELEYDVMITGSRKPFLHSTKDKEKIAKYVEKYEALVRKFQNTL